MLLYINLNPLSQQNGLTFQTL